MFPNTGNKGPAPNSLFGAQKYAFQEKLLLLSPRKNDPKSIFFFENQKYLTECIGL